MCQKFEELLINYCAPALYGIKSANLFFCAFKEVPTLKKDLKDLKCLNPEFDYYILKENKHGIQILVYRKKELAEKIFSVNAYNYLQEHDYPKKKSLKKYLNCLKKKYLKLNDFPHEIGAFLDYDLEDVKAFEADKKNCLYIGYWKVYSNLEKKLQIFDQYTTCKKECLSLFQSGKSLKDILC